jgi:thiol:disulfide interchange protein
MPPPDPAPSGSTRRDPLWLIGLAAVLLVARVATGMYESKHPAERPDLVSWVPIERAEQVSRQTGKPILYDFSAEWCAPCKVMEREVFAEERYAKDIERLVVPVRVVDRQRETGANPRHVDSLQRALAVQAFPTLVVVANGRAVDRQQGFRGAPQMAQWLARASANARRPDSLRSERGVRLRFP